MANPQDLEKFCQGPKAWNAWREENADRTPDLRDARLSLSQRQFGAGNGGPVDLSKVDLEGAELRHATLTGANLARSRLVASDLVHARLENADLSGADLTDAVLDYADLSGANLTGAILIGASLANARGLTAEQIDGAYGDASTVLPSAMLPPESWFPPLEDDPFTGSPAPDDIHYSDPYDILGVEPNASQDQIRTAFRNLVKIYHPDINPGDAEAQEQFKQLSIAYRILGDPEKRTQFDRGEIGGDGEISPEFEAKQHFRRYAYRFYSAAAASLIIAVGAIAGVWYMVLTQGEGGSSRLEIAVADPPNQAEQLTSTGDAKLSLPAPLAKHTPPIGIASSSDEKANPVANARNAPADNADDSSGNSKITGANETASEAAQNAPKEPSAEAAKLATRASNSTLSNDRLAGSTEIQTAKENGQDIEPGTGQIARLASASQLKNVSAALVDNKTEKVTDQDSSKSSSEDADNAAAQKAEEMMEPIIVSTSDKPGKSEEQSATSTRKHQGANKDDASSKGDVEIATQSEEKETPTSSLSQQNSVTKARQDSIDEPRSPAAKEKQRSREDIKKEAAASQEPQMAEGSEAPPFLSPLPQQPGSRKQRIKDPISDLLWESARIQSLPKDAQSTTASLSQDRTSENSSAEEEISELYWYSQSGGALDESKNRSWPEIFMSQAQTDGSFPTIQRDLPVISEIAIATRESEPERTPVSSGPLRRSLSTQGRDQAISNLLTGGF